MYKIYTLTIAALLLAALVTTAINAPPINAQPASSYSLDFDRINEGGHYSTSTGNYGPHRRSPRHRSNRRNPNQLQLRRNRRHQRTNYRHHTQQNQKLGALQIMSTITVTENLTMSTATVREWLVSVTGSKKHKVS